MYIFHKNVIYEYKYRYVIFSKYMLYVCIYIHIIHIHSTHIIEYKFLFTYAINRLTALIMTQNITLQTFYVRIRMLNIF